MQKKLFAELGLSPELLKAVERQGYEEATPIQSETIPILLTGRDLVGQSQTGSGKTAAFAIPAIERVKADLRAPQALILCPTRELAMQVAEEISKLAFFKRGVRELPIYGGASYERQFRGLRDGAQIIIGTPGRVMDHLERKSLALDKVGMVILDEADRMLDMGFRDDIETILSQAPPERQTVFFSATLPAAIKHLITRYTRDAASVRIESKEMTVPAVEQLYYEVDRRSKLDVLCRILDLEDVKLGIIFCSTKIMTDELAEHLAARGYKADRLHGDMSQAMRERVMNRFRQGQCEFLVATDVAARGLDVDDIEVVFNYDLPHDGEDYVHRIGRTGRAGKAGKAITFVSGKEIWRLQNFQRYTNSKIRRVKVPSADEVEEKRAEALHERLRETLENGSYRRQDAAIDRLLEAGHTPTDIASALLHLLAGGGSDDAPKAPANANATLNSRDRDQDRGRERDLEPERRPFAAPPAREPRRPEPRSMENRVGAGSDGSRDDHPPDASLEDVLSTTAPHRRTAAPSEAGPRGKNKFERGQSRFLAPVSHEPGKVRLVFNVGEGHGIRPGDIVGVIAGVTGLGKEVVGAINILPKQALVDVSEECHGEIIEKLNGIRFKGRRLLVDLGRET